MEESAVKKYLDKGYLSDFELEDNGIVFSNIELFVDGLQKELWKTIQLFFIMIFAVTFIIISLLITLVCVFQFACKESIVVKRFLGYGNIRIYRIPFLIVLGIKLIDLGGIVALKSKIGFLYLAIISLIQLIILYRIMARNELKKITTYLKE